MSINLLFRINGLNYLARLGIARNVARHHWRIVRDWQQPTLEKSVRATLILRVLVL